MKPGESLVLTHNDELRLDRDLPLEATFFPAGFRLHIRTNSRDVLCAAEEAWGGTVQEFECRTIEMRAMVERGELSGIPVHRASGDLYSVVSDTGNFAQIDRERLTVGLFVTDRTAADHTLLRWSYLEGIVYMLLSQHYVVPVHSACVMRGGRGVLLAGRSGSGKSTLAFACAKAGWTFVSDDCVLLVAGSDARTAIGRPRQARFRMDAAAVFPELERYATRARPNGKLSIEAPMKDFPEIRTAAKAPVDFVVLLDRRQDGAPGLFEIGAEEAVWRLLDGGPSYGPRVNEMHERTARRLAEAQRYRMRYASVNEALELLDGIE